jgi:hypothetical protein
MPDEPVLTDEVLMDVLKKRGYDVQKLSKPEPALSEDDVKRLVGEALEEASRQAEPPSAEQQFATRYRDALNASRTPWLGEGPRDGEG